MSSIGVRRVTRRAPVTGADRRALWWVAIGAAALLALYWLRPVLTPFFLGAVLAYVWQPLITRLTRTRLPRTLAVVVAILLEALIVGLLALAVLPLFIKELAQLSAQLPSVLERLNENLAPWIKSRLGVDVALDAASLKEAVAEAIRNSEGLGMSLLNSLRIGGLGLLGLFANLVLTPVVQFFLMRDWELILARIRALIPPRTRPQVTGFAREADEALSQYLHGQVLVILVMTVYYTVGLWLTGLEFFLPIGIITGALVFVPYVGAATGFILATLAALLQFQEMNGVIWVWVVFGIGQAIEGNFITPKLVGERIGLHPVAVIFALLAFGQLFGFAGLLIALPASAVLLVALRKLKLRYEQSSLYQDSRDKDGRDDGSGGGSA
jgi:predicted PurR-regulated permease PerM